MSNIGHKKMMGRLGNPYTEKDYINDQDECETWRREEVCRGPGRNCTNGICPMGIRMHEYESRTSESESEWDGLDKNSSKGKDFTIDGD